MTDERIVVVSGLPRSGTSMMMNILTAGGIEPLIDGQRLADESNPKGYFELERVKQLEKDHSFLAEAKGKVVKIVSPLLKHLAPDFSYSIVFMDRNIQEVLASQQQMMIRRGETGGATDDEKMASIYARHLTDVKGWIDRQSNISIIEVSYNEVLKDARPGIEKVAAFLGRQMDQSAMLAAVDRSLYRQQKG